MYRRHYCLPRPSRCLSTFIDLFCFYLEKKKIVHRKRYFFLLFVYVLLYSYYILRDISSNNACTMFNVQDVDKMVGNLFQEQPWYIYTYSTSKYVGTIDTYQYGKSDLEKAHSTSPPPTTHSKIETVI